MNPVAVVLSVIAMCLSLTAWGLASIGGTIFFGMVGLWLILISKFSENRR